MSRRGEIGLPDSRVDLRAAWLFIALAGIALNIWAAVDSAAHLSECQVYRPTGGVETWDECWSPAFEVYGIWPFVGTAVLCAVPAVVAAISLRKSTSWLMVIVYIAIAVAALAGNASAFGGLFAAAPQAWLAIIVATVAQRHS
ncbi:hypothetical protein [Gordonia terrae]|uniref:hypothetical protein n=1 Tax=Gordonia terrae TaxID=2055 RepID=UPI003F6A804D